MGIAYPLASWIEETGPPVKTKPSTTIPTVKMLHRWKASIVSGFDHVVSRVENHEAIVVAAIREARESAAGARVKLNRLKRDGERMRERLADLRTAEEAWTARCLKIRSADEDKAIECLRRRKGIQNEIRHLESELTRHQELDHRLTNDLAIIEERIRELTRRKNALSAREFRARALEIADAGLADSVTDLEDIFDRWEIKLAETEPIAGVSPLDLLESEFVAEEERELFRVELDALQKERSPGANS